MLEKWFELLLCFVAWLVALVYDVVVLSAGMLWDRGLVAFDWAQQLYGVLRTELRQNSGRPAATLRNWWQRIDRRFAADSKWALWRRFLRRGSSGMGRTGGFDGLGGMSSSSAGTGSRIGRLPTTGDEAMHSLLNCKGKDAYSILGVAPDSQQEVVRKHYKKIAVLVHPDKNKQPGAEEAFKILQRAFELIGEPVS